MSNTNVTIRHARQALALLIGGAMREIEHAMVDEAVGEQDAVYIRLLDELVDALTLLSPAGARLTNLEKLNDALQEMLADENAGQKREWARTLLAEHELLP